MLKNARICHSDESAAADLERQTKALFQRPARRDFSTVLPEIRLLRADFD
jgi:hypothetical protein